MRRALVIAALAALPGCTLPLNGLGSGGHSGGSSGGSDGSTSSGLDAGADAGEAGAPDAATGSCTSSIPAGWTLVALELSRGVCPAGFTPVDLVGDPQAMPGACACACEITAPPSCTSGTLQGSFSSMKGGPACAMKVPQVSVSGGGCTQLQPGGPVPASIAIDTLPSTGGACTASVMADTTQVASSEVRACEVTGGAADAEAVCDGSPPPGFSSCISAPGQVQCPAASPFNSRTVLAASETLVCTPCTGCTVSGNCTAPLVTYYSDYLCNTPVATFPADGSCTQPNWSGTIAGVEYHATAQPSCSGTGSTATFQAVSPQTLCCR
jgi:hypothetical protein